MIYYAAANKYIYRTVAKPHWPLFYRPNPLNQHVSKSIMNVSHLVRQIVSRYLFHGQVWSVGKHAISDRVKVEKIHTDLI
jgi:hypothetical protein